jgi:hypothetical protein
VGCGLGLPGFAKKVIPLRTGPQRFGLLFKPMGFMGQPFLE